MKHLLGTRKNGRSGPVAGRPPAIRVSRRFSAPSEQVFDAWLDPAVAGKWLFATAIPASHDAGRNRRPRRGLFRFAERPHRAIIEHTGEYVEIVPHRRLVFTRLDGGSLVRHYPRDGGDQHRSRPAVSSRWSTKTCHHTMQTTPRIAGPASSTAA